LLELPSSLSDQGGFVERGGGSLLNNKQGIEVTGSVKHEQYH